MSCKGRSSYEEKQTICLSTDSGIVTGEREVRVNSNTKVTDHLNPLVKNLLSHIENTTDFLIKT